MSVEREGTVERKQVAKGSKSEHEAVVLNTGDQHIVLRRLGGNPFSDPELERLVGKRIRAHGAQHGPALVMETWEET